jgi:hypothetical protein
MKTKENLVDDLQLLGDTPDEIAELLNDLDIKGDRRTNDSCPIVNYLEVRGYSYPKVTQTYVSCFQGNLFLRITMPVHNFIVRFDNGKFPELIADGGP